MIPKIFPLAPPLRLSKCGTYIVVLILWYLYYLYCGTYYAKYAPSYLFVSRGSTSMFLFETALDKEVKITQTICRTSREPENELFPYLLVHGRAA